MRIQEQLEKFIGGVGFDIIVLLYFTLIFAFATIFFVLSFTGGHGLYAEGKSIGTGLGGYLDAVYFSFVTSTSLGYGDIHPVGVSRLFSIIEVFISLIVFGVLISKLLSVKQEKILDELYEMSHQEMVTRIISGLYNFRAEVDRIINKLGVEELTKAETEEVIQSIEANMHLLSSYLIDVKKILSKDERKHLKKLSDFRADIILDNLHSSVSKIEELIAILKARNIVWKSDSILKNLDTIFGTTENICTECMSGQYENIQGITEELRRHSSNLKNM